MQLFAQSPRAWRFPEHAAGGSRALPRAARRGGDRRGARARALPLQPRDAGRDGLRQEPPRRCSRRSTPPCAIEADGVVFHVGSHLGAGFEAGLERCVPALRAGARAHAPRRPGSCSRTRPARAARSAARSTSSRARRRARPASAARRLPRLLPPLRLRRRRRRPEGGRRDARRARPADRARPAARAARQRRRRAARLEPRPARERARGRARRAARRVPRASGGAEAAGGDGDPGPGRPRPRRRRGGEAARPARRWGEARR